MDSGFIFINQPVFFFYIGLAVLITLICRDDIRKVFRRVETKHYVVLVLILILATLLRSYAYTDCERWLADERYFMDKTTGVIPEQMPITALYRGIGFYYVLGAFFAFAGPVYSNLFLLNFFGGCALVITSFFMSYLIFKNPRVSLMASFLFACSPVFVIISASGSYTLMAVLFSSVTLIFLFMFFRTRKFCFYMASLFMLICTIQMRPDYIVFAFLFLMTCLIYRECFRDRRLYIFTAGFLLANIYLFWVIYHYFLVIFLYDRYVTGAALDSGNLLFSILFNSARLFSENIIKNFLSFFGFNAIISLLSVFALIGGFYFYKKGKNELFFLLSYFWLFFLAYSCLHQEGFFSSGLKYVPSPLPPLFFMASLGIISLADKIQKQRIFLASVLTAILCLSVYHISIHNMETEISPRYQEYTYLMGNIKDVNSDCYVIYTGRPTLFKNAFNFDYNKYIEINDTDSLEGFISRRPRGCFYVYSGYYSVGEDLTERTSRLYNNTLFLRLSEEFETEEIIDKNLTEGRIQLYYFEN